VVHAGDEQVPLSEGIAAVARLDGLAADQLEAQGELLGEFVLPLGDEPAGRHHQTAGHIGSEQKLLDVEPGHDRLAGSGVVGEQEAKRLAGKELPVDGADLVRERLDEGQVHGQKRVEEVGQADPARLGDEREGRSVGVEGKARAATHQRQALLVGAVEEALCDLAVWLPEGEGDC
jgi:hypothetical protein